VVVEVAEEACGREGLTIGPDTQLLHRKPLANNNRLSCGYLFDEQMSTRENAFEPVKSLLHIRPTPLVGQTHWLVYRRNTPKYARFAGDAKRRVLLERGVRMQDSPVGCTFLCWLPATPSILFYPF
jgi:hypothetical protein